MDRVGLAVFAEEVIQGLSTEPKRLSSKWFYDEVGDDLFVQIMKLPGYYLTDCEFQIFEQQRQNIIEGFDMSGKDFDLYELGAGDGTKTLELLKGLRNVEFTYKPIDISIHAINNLERRVSREMPNIQVEGIQGEYFDVLAELDSLKPKVILFMGSNIGNLMDSQANDFLKRLSRVMNPGDKLLLGVDLKKPSAIVLPAYNDAAGITAKFNLNLLTRINLEFDANFDLHRFRHAPEYDEERGWALSYIESLVDQEVHVKALSKRYSFKKGEKIFMEVSRKYDDDTISAITQNTSLDIVSKFYDQQKYFCDVLFEKQ
ncbi:MAG TPA: L-histidine N(alpha)-methyltransferase [Flavobacteriales bacterium]|nr:L-histidine N(alpha)-methyltransferase [Flavobacteriales bacterium]